MNRLLTLISLSIFLAITAGIVNFEILPDPALTIADEDGQVQILVYLFFVAIALTFATVAICFFELFSLVKMQITQIRLPEGRQ